MKKEYDMIVPSHFIPWKFFSSNVRSWMEKLPIRTLYFGNNNPDKKFRKDVEKYLERYDKIEFVDQSGIKTLGYQLKDLMERIEGEWFIYCHADVFIAKYSFLVMEAFKNEENVGIIESERVQYSIEDPGSIPKTYPYYHFRDRSFSGYQLIRMDAIKEVLDEIEDDYVYRNEDVIFQNACTTAGYRYVKALSAMHVHTPTDDANYRWTPKGEFKSEEESRAKTFDMQIKGIVKYCTPDPITKVAWRDAFGVCFKENRTDLFEFIDNFVMKHNPDWKMAIQETITEMIRGVYR